MTETYIYQIGEVVLDVERGVLPSYYSTETEYEIKNVQSSFNKVINASRYNLQNTQIGISGGLKYETAKSRYTVQLDQKLRSYQGIVVHIFSCLINDFLNNKCEEKQIWMYTTAIIKNVQVSRGSNYSAPTIEVNFDLLDYWKCIDTNLFCYGDDYGNELDTLEEPTVFLPEAYPTFEVAIENKNQWKKKNFSTYEFLYNPDYWNSLYCDDCLCNECGQFSYYANTNKWHEIESDEYVFGYAPISIYSLTGLNKNETVEITTISKQEFRNITRLTTFSLLDLNDQIVSFGYTEFDENDVVVFGDVKRYLNGQFYRPAFVYRNGSLLENIKPVFVYDDDFPAMINGGKSRIYIKASNDAKIAWVHQFRRI